MLSADDVKNVKFTKVRGGYKQEDVDIFLDRVEADYRQYDRTEKEYQAKIDGLNQEIEHIKLSQNSIQNVLINAQRLADQIVGEAKLKSEEIIRNAEANISVITAREKELSAAFELKAKERREALERELADMVKTAQIKADSTKAAAEDSVARQQLLYDKLKMEIAAFKATVMAKYKEHLEAFQSLPDSVPMDPKQITELVAAAVDKAPSPESFIPEKREEAAPAEEKATVPEKPKSEGFSIKDLTNLKEEDDI